MKKISVIIMILALAFTAQAQKPKVGKKIPDFTLTKITHYGKQQATAKDFEGKWLILDFWGTTCSSCISGFPKLNELQAAFKDSIDFVLVGVNSVAHAGKNIEALYETVRERKQLQLASAYDSILNRKWGVGSYPHMLIIDPQGIVKHITTGHDLTKEKLKDLISGKKVTLYRKDVDPPQFNPHNLTAAKDRIMWQSVITRAHGEASRSIGSIREGITIAKYYGNFGLASVPLAWIYHIAYAGYLPSFVVNVEDSLYGKISAQLDIRAKNVSPFEYNYDDAVLSGLYNYSLTLPDDQYEEKKIMAYMQADLKRVFGYEATFETQEIPVVQLVAKNGAAGKLQTKGEPRQFQALEEKGGSSSGSLLTTFHTGFEAKNMEMKNLLNCLKFYFGDDETLFFDVTGIKSNVDIKIDADMTSFEAVRKALQLNGLDFEIVKKPVKVLVISDGH